MRILVSAGIKTPNIVKSIEKKFSASGDDFLMVNYLEEIEEIFGRGDYFDKALILEPSITKEDTITDEYNLRTRVNAFANMMNNRPKRYNYVFMTKDENLANIIQEETIFIDSESAVVLKQPPYPVTFIISVITTDVKQLPEDIVYKPKAITSNEELSSDNSSVLEDLNTDTEEYNYTKASNDFDNELFDGNTIGTDKRVTDDVSIQLGDELDIPKDVLEDEGNSEKTEAEETEQLGFEEDYDDPTAGMYDPTVDGSRGYLGNGAQSGMDEAIDLDSSPIKQSIITEDPVENQPVQQVIEPEPQDEVLEGFDTDEDEPELTNQFMDISDYEQEPEAYTPEPQGPAMGAESEAQAVYDFPDENQFSTGFEEGNGTGFETPEGIGMPSFDNDDYDQEDEQKDYNQNTEQEIYNAETETETGFSPNDYEQNNGNNGVDPATLAGAGMMAGAELALQGDKLGKKKGLLGGLLKKNVPNQAPPQMPPMANPIPPQQQVNPIGNIMGSKGAINPDIIKNELKPFAARGNSIVVTGCGGCGTSTVAYNLANIVAQLGYTVLLVDMDTEGRTQSYISKDNYESMEPDGANLLSAVNSSNGINTHVSVVRTGFHLLTMGLGTDSAHVQDILHKEKISRFYNLAKTSHNFIIYDIPFNTATDFLSDIVYMCDNLVLVTDASNWGITKTMLSVCNIDSDDMRDTIFNRAQLVFNRYRNLYRVLGKKVRTCVDITKVMDQKVLELVGEDPGFYFESLHIAGIINDDPDFELGWFEEVQYSDNKKGQNIFLQLIEHIVLKK